VVFWTVVVGEYFVRLLVNTRKENFTWNLVIVYGDAQHDGKAKFLVELIHVIKHSQYPLLIAGDFNMTRRVTDQGHLMEIALTGRKFTWYNNHEDRTFELLDRVLVSPT
jgi:endonuclease/exonuclease/phosphatase family metal-dependent hydrolase